MFHWIGMFSPWILVVWVLAWLADGPVPAEMSEPSMNVYLLAITYPLGAAAMGALNGALLPHFTRGRLRALGAGAVSLAPFCAACVLPIYVADPDYIPVWATWAMGAFMALIFGAALAYGVRKGHRALVPDGTIPRVGGT